MKKLEFIPPIKGSIINLNQVNDPGFSSGAMGPGIGIIPDDGKVYAPFDGKVEVLFETKHALGITSTDNNAAILIHIGLDTVNMAGKGFTAHIQQGDTVRKGDLLLEFDIPMLKNVGYDLTTPVIITNAAEFSYIAIENDSSPIIIKELSVSDKNTDYVTAPTETSNNLPTEQRVAKKILANIGGIDNIRSVEHCATRLRLILKNKDKINEKSIENIDGVKGQFFTAAQYQIILGTGFVNKVYNVIVSNDSKLAQSSNKDAAYADMTLLQKTSRILGDIFVPIIPVLVATGLFMGLRSHLSV